MRQLKQFMRNRKAEMLGCGPCTCRTLQCWRYASENCGCGDFATTEEMIDYTIDWFESTSVFNDLTPEEKEQALAEAQEILEQAGDSIAPFYNAVKEGRTFANYAENLGLEVDESGPCDSSLYEDDEAFIIYVSTAGAIDCKYLALVARRGLKAISPSRELVNKDAISEYLDWVTVEEATYQFKDWNGEIIKFGTVKKGETPTAPTNVPARPGYRFVGWSPAVGPIDTDTTFTTVYSNQYTVNITSEDTTKGTVSPLTVTATYGDSISASGNILTIGATNVTATAETGYVFSSWGTLPEMVTGNLNITATFTNAPTVDSLTLASNSNVGILNDPESEYLWVDLPYTINSYTPNVTYAWMEFPVDREGILHIHTDNSEELEEDGGIDLVYYIDAEEGYYSHVELDGECRDGARINLHGNHTITFYQTDDNQFVNLTLSSNIDDALYDENLEEFITNPKIISSVYNPDERVGRLGIESDEFNRLHIFACPCGGEEVEYIYSINDEGGRYIEEILLDGEGRDWNNTRMRSGNHELRVIMGVSSPSTITLNTNAVNEVVLYENDSPIELPHILTNYGERDVFLMNDDEERQYISLVSNPEEEAEEYVYEIAPELSGCDYVLLDGVVWDGSNELLRGNHTITFHLTCQEPDVATFTTNSQYGVLIDGEVGEYVEFPFTLTSENPCTMTIEPGEVDEIIIRVDDSEYRYVISPQFGTFLGIKIDGNTWEMDEFVELNGAHTIFFDVEGGEPDSLTLTSNKPNYGILFQDDGEGMSSVVLPETINSDTPNITYALIYSPNEWEKRLHIHNSEDPEGEDLVYEIAPEEGYVDYILLDGETWDGTQTNMYGTHTLTFHLTGLE